MAEYTCHASNSQGESEQSIQLTGGRRKFMQIKMAIFVNLINLKTFTFSVSVFKGSFEPVSFTLFVCSRKTRLSSIVVKSPMTKTGPK